MEQFVKVWGIAEETSYEVGRYYNKNSAAELVQMYGTDSLAYLTLEKDKKHYFGVNTEGFIAYVIIDKIMVCMGNPVCSEGDMKELLSEFLSFSRAKAYKVCFCSISKTFSTFLGKNGFSVSKYGEEALLDLPSYELKGSSTSKLRQKLKRAEKAGITVQEYVPQKQRDYSLEQKIVQISEEWLASKNGKMGFTLGDLNLENPLDRRYFAAIDENNELQAILMFSPFNNGEGYFLDVMRRSSNSIPGVMEKSIIDASMKMRDEGVKIVSLGLAPLAGINPEQGSGTFLEKGMHFVYKHVNQGYDFKALHDYKKKFAPTRWEPRYIAHQSKLSPFKVAYVMVKARKGEGVWKQLLTGIWEARKALAAKSQ
jgi:phosphatidylglycerol lysyltransferase